MTSRKTNVAASVKDRLLRLAKARGDDLNFILARYGLERLLYRLSRSEYEKDFIVKGAMLFAVWSGSPHRATKDLDLLGRGAPDLHRLEAVFRDVVGVPVDDDGLVFSPATIRAEAIREEAVYDGIRIHLEAQLGSAVIPLQVDVGFGDAVVPDPVRAEFPTLLAQPAPKIRAYPRTAVVAEKLHAMVVLGIINSRMKDFFDIWFLCRTFAFDGAELQQAIAATFERRQTAIPDELPLALTTGFSRDVQKQTQWRAFLKRASIAEAELTSVVAELATFLSPLMEALRDGNAFNGRWSPRGPWSMSK